MLKEEIPHKGGRKPSTDTRVLLKNIGISYDQSSKWQTIADLPEEALEEHIAKVKG